MNILMASSESLPFSKTGGLADVIFSLSKEFVKLKNNVSIVLPKYKTNKVIKGVKLNKIFQFDVKMNWRIIPTSVYHCYYLGIDFYFIENQKYFERDNLYGYYDDGERFAYFTNAVVKLIASLPYKIDIVHLHDHQVGLLPCVIKTLYSDKEIYKGIKYVLTIHNPEFKGYFSKDSLYDFYNLPINLYNEGKIRLDEQVSTLKAGIVFSDKITTVSPTHAKELLTYEGSKGLNYDLNLRKNDFVGILNGMDNDFFNPRTDTYIYKNYGIKDVLRGKNENKTEFCKKYNLDPKLPLFAIVSRLSSQKGIELLYPMVEFLSYTGGNIALIGSGEKGIEDKFVQLGRVNNKHIFIYIGYNEELAHKVYAASDFLLMPSSFEPCGLSQMIAQKYGSLPIVRKTGGLKDTVNCYDLSDEEKKAKDIIKDGFGFDNYSISEAILTCAKAMNLYNGKKDVYKKMVINAMKLNHTWDESARIYIALYESINK